MKILALLVTGSLVLLCTATQLPAQASDRTDVERSQTAPDESAKAPSASPQTSESEQTGGDTRPNAVDPAQATKTGANVGEGASYSRSTEKGQSTLSDSEQKK
jgi:hypothetical protein